MDPMTLVERSCAWELSDLFLDTKIQGHELDEIILKFFQLPREFCDIEAVFWDDIFPTMIWNLAFISGEWCVFSEEEVCDPINNTRASYVWLYLGPFTSRLKRVFWGNKVTPFWEGVK